MSKQVMQKALEALKRVEMVDDDCNILASNLSDAVVDAIAELRAAIAAPEVEPDAFVSRSPNHVSVSWIGKTEWPNLTNLFTTPPDTEAMRKELERVKGELEQESKFIEVAFMAHPNLDLDIAAQGGGE